MIPKSRPYLGARELLAAIVFGAGRSQFEAAMANRAGACFGLTFSYAHTAFYALIKTLGLTQAEVILPAYTCDIMAGVIVRTDNIPVFVDIDLADFNMDLDALKVAITAKTRMIVATHMFGYPTDVQAIRQMVGDEKIIIVEDAALRLPGGDELKGDTGLFSFGPGKPLFTVKGGIIVTNKAELFEKLKMYRDEHMNRLSAKEWAKRWIRLLAAYSFKYNFVYGLALRWGLLNNSFERSAASIPADYASAYANFQARVGMAQIDKADTLLVKRRAIVSWYNQALQDIPGFTPAPLVEGATYSHYSARVESRDARQFSQKMYALNVQTGRTYDYAAPNFKKYKPYVKQKFPHAEQAGREVVNLPFYPTLSQKEVQLITSKIRQVV